jgi:TolB-like protein
MAAGQPTDDPRPKPSVFLSYASEDRALVQAIRDALPGLGLDVWYDESELGGGEAWDQKIRRQIRECDFFMPVISARTEARAEGYFRREWRFAVERTLDMADDHVFLVPVVIDNTVGETARVPEKFLTVQWSRLPDGRPTPAFEALCRRLASGQTAPQPPPQRKASGARADKPSKPPPPPPAQIPEFPRQEPGQNARFYGQAAAWTIQSGWIAFQRLPRWIRILVYCWVAILLMKGCDSASDHTPSKRTARAEEARAEAEEAKNAALSKADAEKIRAITQQYMTGPDRPDIAGMAAQIARQFSTPGPGGGAGAGAATKNNLLAIPFSAPAGDQHAKGIADAVFGQLFGKVAIAHHGHVRLSTDASLPADPTAAGERGRADHSTYVVYGAVEGESLNVKVVESDDGSVEWSKSYPLEGADTARIATEVQENIPED